MKASRPGPWVCAGVVLAASVWARPGAGESGPCQLMVSSKPRGATVFVDDKERGPTPVVVDGLSTGKHGLRLVLDGHETWTRTVRLRPGPRLVSADLKKLPDAAAEATPTAGRPADDTPRPSGAAAVWLAGLPRAGRWVFVGPPCAKYPEGGQQVAERRALAALKRAAKKAGVPENKRKLHTFRHFFASFCANNGVEMAKLMRWLGHSSIEMVMRYYSLGEDESRQAMVAVPFDGMGKRSAS